MKSFFSNFEKQTEVIIGLLGQIAEIIRQHIVYTNSKLVLLDNVEVARHLNCTTRTVYALKKSGRLKPYRIGRRDYYLQSDLLGLG